MSFQAVFWSILAVGVVVLLPIVLACSVVGYLRGKGSERHGSGGISSAIGAGLQELDRLVARPSAEFRVEAERPVLKREDDAGDD